MSWILNSNASIRDHHQFSHLPSTNKKTFKFCTLYQHFKILFNEFASLKNDYIDCSIVFFKSFLMNFRWNLSRDKHDRQRDFQRFLTESWTYERWNSMNSLWLNEKEKNINPVKNYDAIIFCIFDVTSYGKVLILERKGIQNVFVSVGFFDSIIQFNWKKQT